MRAERDGDRRHSSGGMSGVEQRGRRHEVLHRQVRVLALSGGPLPQRQRPARAVQTHANVHRDRSSAIGRRAQRRHPLPRTT